MNDFGPKAFCRVDISRLAYRLHYGLARDGLRRGLCREAACQVVVHIDGGVSTLQKANVYARLEVQNGAVGDSLSR